MANNDEILNELFFKKKGYSEKQKDKMAQYTPVSKTGDIKSMFNGNSIDGFVVSDADEVKKRLVGALGMAMGNNTIKSSASRATKRFPIIVSDDISPETVVMLKTMMEEQYASYIDLLVSNMIINLTDYDTSGENGNIAIQALDQLDGPNFGTSRIANAAKNGKLSLDTIMANNPGWKFLRTNENAEITTGNPILDEFLDGAIICENKDVNDVASVLYEELQAMNEANTRHYYSAPLSFEKQDITKVSDSFMIQHIANVIYPGNAAEQANFINNTQMVPGTTVFDTVSKRVFVRGGGEGNVGSGVGLWYDYYEGKAKEEPAERRLSDVVQDLVDQDIVDNYSKYKIRRDKDGAFDGVDRLITPSVFVNANDLENVLNRSIAEILTGAGARNDEERSLSMYIRDRFEKASFLLASNEISGSEYISYLTDRLGIPVSDRVRVQILSKYPVAKVVFKNTKKYDNKNINTDDMIKEMRNNIDRNTKHIVTRLVPDITGISGKDVAIISASSVGGAATAGGVTAGALAIAAAPIMWPAYVAAGVGAAGAGITAAIIRMLNKKKYKSVMNAVSGWERVEALIDEMDFNRADLMNHKMKVDIKLLPEYSKDEVFRKEQSALFNDFSAKMNQTLGRVQLAEQLTLKPYINSISDDYCHNMLENLQLIDAELQNDPEFVREYEQLSEGAKYVINTKKPGDVIIKQQKIKAKDVADIIPSFGTKDIMAYGSVEYDKREIKDRKFNEPLILTVKFKERYSDGKYADNELTAVIGILGVVTRVPSEEMATILRANVDGKTLSNFFKGDDSNSAKDLIGNVISSFVGSKYADKLPKSGKIWANLEKVTALAVANKLAGNNNGNISNAHLVFSQREIDLIKSELGVDYLKNANLAAQLMKKYSAFRIIVCNDAMQYVYSYDDPDAISWDDAPYSAYMGKSNADQMLSAFTQFNRMKL